MITKKSREEIKLMKYAGNVVALVHKEMKKQVAPGISTYDLDKVAFDIIKHNRCIPSFLGYNGFEGSICTSINEQVVHGIPSKDVILKEGDIISVDIGATYKGLVADSAWTYPVGKINNEVQTLLEVCEKSLFEGIKKACDGASLDEVSGAIEDVANAGKYGIVRQYGGHGVGRSLHEEPFIYNYRTGSKIILKNGYTIAIEPMINLGCDDVLVLKDNWTVVTADKKPSAHFEHTILINDDKPEIITKLT